MTWTSMPILVMVAALIALHFIAWWGLRLGLYLFYRSTGVARKIRGRDDVAGLSARFSTSFPRTTKLLHARLTPHRHTGLALTLLVCAAIYLVSLFGGLVGELMEADELVRMDEDINQWLGAIRSDAMVNIFAWITELGGSPTAVAVALATTGLLWGHPRRHMIVPLWVTILGSQITTYTGKFVMARQRPEFITDVVAATPSFPSGHATTAMAVYGFIAYIIASDLTSLRQRFELVYWSAVLIGLIGFSRMLLAVHYTSDVAAGFLVGSFWLLVGFALAEHKHRRVPARGLP